MKRIVLIPFLALLGCAETSNFAPSDINFSALSITSEAQAFDVFVDTAYSIAVAESLVDDCDMFGVDGRESDFAEEAVTIRLEEFYGSDETGKMALVLRLTGDADAQSLDDSEGLSEEVKVILTDRLYTYFRERGALVGNDFGDFACSAAETEKQTGSLIGRFLYRK